MPLNVYIYGDNKHKIEGYFTNFNEDYSEK